VGSVFPVLETPGADGAQDDAVMAEPVVDGDDSDG
jgi:hypothetical protein